MELSKTYRELEYEKQIISLQRENNQLKELIKKYKLLLELKSLFSW